MADVERDQKTEEPTPKRLEEAFKKGQFARSSDVQAALILWGGVIAIGFMVTGVSEHLAEYFRTHFNRLASIGNSEEELLKVLGESGAVFALAILPFLLFCGAGGLLGCGLQTGFRLTPEVFGLKWENLEFSKGWTRLFSAQSLLQLPFEAVKLAVIGGTLWFAMRQTLQSTVYHAPLEPLQLAHFLHERVHHFLLWVASALSVLALAHYLFERWKTHRDLRMTLQEVRDEHKQTEGDPLVRSRQRRFARQLLQKQMLSAVPLADVVVTNPTHFAVALRYERGVDHAPVVLARGHDRLALRIRAIAAQYEVPQVENKPLARLLWKHGVVGQPIPVHLYQAVAQILALVYRSHRYYFHRLKARRAAAQSRTA